MTDVQTALLELLKASLFQAEPRFPARVDWEQVFQEAKEQSVVALAFPAVPQGAAGGWQLYAQRIQAKYIRLLYEQSKVVRLFEARGIPMVILKGAAAAVYYPVPFRRTAGDVDFLVPPERIEEGRRLMEENGYQLFADGDRHIAYLKGGIEFEMHRYFSIDQYDIDQFLTGGLAHPVRREINHISFPALPDDENGLVILAHIRQHLKTYGLGLRQVIDWMMFVHARLDDAAWADRFQALARKADLEILAVTVTYLCKTRLGLPDKITWCDQADSSLAEALMRHLLDHGNMGIKLEGRDRHVEEMADLLHKIGLLKQLHMSALSHWPAARKRPYLWPAAWLYQIGRWMGTAAGLLVRGFRVKEEIGREKEKADFQARLGIK